MNDAFVKTEIKNNVGYITFYHPKGNSFPSIQLNKLVVAIDELGRNLSVKAVVLQSKGEKVFCAGASFDELLDLDNLADAQQFFMGFAKVIHALVRCPKFVIAAVQGKVVGGGVGLVAACDYAIASPNSSIKLSELSIGIGPFVIEPPISRKMGVVNFTELTMNPKTWKAAEWALEYKLFDMLSNDEDFDLCIQQYAESFNAYSVNAMQALKEIIWKETSHWEALLKERAALSGRLVLREETKAILTNFKAK